MSSDRLKSEEVLRERQPSSASQLADASKKSIIADQSKSQQQKQQLIVEDDAALEEDGRRQEEENEDVFGPPPLPKPGDASKNKSKVHDFNMIIFFYIQLIHSKQYTYVE